MQRTPSRKKTFSSEKLFTSQHGMFQKRIFGRPFSAFLQGVISCHPHLPNFPVCLRVSESADRLVLQSISGLAIFGFFGLCDAGYVSSRYFLRLLPSVGSI